MKFPPFLKIQTIIVVSISPQPTVTSHHYSTQSSPRLHSQIHSNNILGSGPVSSRWSLLFSFPYQNAESVSCSQVGIIQFIIHSQRLSSLWLFLFLFFMVSANATRRTPVQYFDIGQHHFLPNPFHFIIYHPLLRPYIA